MLRVRLADIGQSHIRLRFEYSSVCVVAFVVSRKSKKPGRSTAVCDVRSVG